MERTPILALAMPTMTSRRAQPVARGVGVNGGQRSVVARVHGLQHVQRLLAAHLAHDDAVGTHTQGVDHQFADVDGAVAFDVGRARFHARHVRLLQPQFGGVFDGDDALVFRDVAGERVEQRGLAGAGAAADQDVQARLARRPSAVPACPRSAPASRTRSSPLQQRAVRNGGWKAAGRPPPPAEWRRSRAIRPAGARPPAATIRPRAGPLATRPSR